MDRFDEQLRRQARLQWVVVPPLELLHLFQPDEDGRLEEVTLEEAQERKFEHYLSRRLCTLDKVFETRERVAVVVRCTDTRLSLGERALVERRAAERRRRFDAAVRGVAVGRALRRR